MTALLVGYARCSTGACWRRRRRARGGLWRRAGHLDDPPVAARAACCPVRRSRPGAGCRAAAIGRPVRTGAGVARRSPPELTSATATEPIADPIQAARRRCPKQPVHRLGHVLGLGWTPAGDRLTLLSLAAGEEFQAVGSEFSSWGDVPVERLPGVRRDRWGPVLRVPL